MGQPTARGIRPHVAAKRHERSPVPRFEGLHPSTPRASETLASVPRTQTRCERLLRRELLLLGYRPRYNAAELLGKPDIVLVQERVLIFCDGDFWHGRHWGARRDKVRRGANPSYWVKKIETNMARDAKHTRRLRRFGWSVLRVWESDILTSATRVARRIDRFVHRRVAGRNGCNRDMPR